MQTLLTILLTIIGLFVLWFLWAIAIGLSTIKANKQGIDDAIHSGRKNNTFAGKHARAYEVGFKHGMKRRNAYRSQRTYTTN